MSEQLSEFKCPNCGAPLRWKPELGKLHCENCSSDFEADGSVPGSRDFADVKEFHWGSYKQGLNNETLANTHVYNCVSCGAVIEADEDTVATACPYCGNNVVLNDRLGAGQKPNAVIPFKFKPKDLPTVVAEYCRGKKLLPKNFFDRQELTKLQGLYVPFWLDDCHVAGPSNLQGVITTSHKSGGYLITESTYYMLERDGEMDFSLIPVDGSQKMDNDLMDSLEPFDFSEMKEFNSDYLAGYLANRFDEDPDQCLPRANERVLTSAKEAIRSSCPGFGQISFMKSGLEIKDASVKYVLLPVYLFSSSYNGVTYRFGINGQTGKMVGELPEDKGKATRMSLIAFAAAFAAVMLITSIL